MSIDDIKLEDVWNEFKSINERWLINYYRRNVIVEGNWEKLDGERNTRKESNN